MPDALEGVKVGTWLHCNGELLKVAHLTPTRATCGPNTYSPRFNVRTGRMIGSYNWANIATDEQIQRARLDRKRADVYRAIDAARRDKTLTMAQCDEIMAVLKGQDQP